MRLLFDTEHDKIKKVPIRERLRERRGDIQKQYKPYHSWRHGYRREKVRKRVMKIAAILLFLEGMILITRYVREHTYETLYEREISVEEGEFYGIGFEPREGTIFWFYNKKEPEMILPPEA